MRVVKCIYNHFFDADKYTVCPQCGASMASGGESEPVGNRRAEQPVSRGIPAGGSKAGETFGVFKNKAAAMLSRKPKAASQPTGRSSGNNYDNLKRFNSNNTPVSNNQGKNVLNANSVLNDMAFDEAMNKPLASSEESSVVTPDLHVPVAASAPVIEFPEVVEPDVKESESVVMPVDSSVDYSVPESIPEPIPEVVPNVVDEPVPEVVPKVIDEPAPEVSSVENDFEDESLNSETNDIQDDSLFNEVKKVAADNDGKTVGFFSASRSSNNDEAGKNNESSADLEDEPVVGWLVCIEGPCIGQSFNIYAGKNSLGRSHSNRIVINKDRSISREKHTWIIFEPKHGDFFAQPGDSSGLTYVNDEMIIQATKLEKWSRIEIGNTKLLLVPLCDDEFSWEKYL